MILNRIGIVQTLQLCSFESSERARAHERIHTVRSISLPSSFELNCILMIELELIQYYLDVQAIMRPDLDFAKRMWQSHNIKDTQRTNERVKKNVNLISVLIFQCLFGWQSSAATRCSIHIPFSL